MNIKILKCPIIYTTAKAPTGGPDEYSTLAGFGIDQYVYNLACTRLACDFVGLGNTKSV